MLKEKHGKLYYITTILFAVYLAFLVWVILFKLELSLAGIEKVREYNFIPFHYEDGNNIRFHFSEVIDNMVVFIPIGVYLCLLFRKVPFWVETALVFVISLALECSQYIFAIGRFDITDLITNTVGGVVGIGICMIGRALFHNKEIAERAIAVLINLVTVLIVGGMFLILSLN